MARSGACKQFCLTSMSRIPISPLIIFLLVALATIPLLTLPNVWHAWQPASCLPDNCFCEANRDSFVVQPVNTYSNLIFVFVGLVILANMQNANASRNLLRQQRAIQIVFGIAMLVIGAGSFFYHASLTFVAQWFDVIGMDLFITLALLYNIARLQKFNGTQFALVYITLNITLGISLVAIPQLRREIFGALVLITIVLEAWLHHTQQPKIELRWFSAALASFFAAYTIWLLDNSGIICAPTSLFQGHAVWHLLTALSAGLLYQYYLSEQ